ncbi:MAG: MFS transporter [Steroidobacteraceae bacterium]
MLKGKVFTYENRVLVLLGLAFGIAFFDRNSGTILVPYIEQDLHLDNMQTGLLGSGLSLTWALGAYLIARWSDASGVRKPFLLGFLLIFSVCSFISGLSRSFPVLLVSRMVMGAVEGPFLPVCLAVMAVESSERRRGINAGVMQNFFASVLGQSLAPLLLVALAQHFGWRSAFYVAGIPGLLCAIAVLLWVREPDKAAQAAVDTQGVGGSGKRMGLLAMLKVRNILLCCVVSIFMVAWLGMGWTFLPKFFTDYRHFSPTLMSYVMTALGIASALSAFVVPALSDRLGRKPVMVAFCLLGAVSPLAALYYQGSPLVMGGLMFIGWFGTGTFPLFMGVIPGETISRRYAATAMGLVVCAGEIGGGSGITTLAGSLADVWNLATPVLIEAACALIGGLFCFLLIETAPVKVSAAAAHRLAGERIATE